MAHLGGVSSACGLEELVDRHGRVALQVAELGVGSVVHQQPLFLFVFLRHLVRNKRLARVPARQKALPELEWCGWDPIETRQSAGGAQRRVCATRRVAPCSSYCTA